MLPLESRLCNRVLRNDTAIIFDIHVQIRSRQHSIAELQNLGEAFRRELMLDITSDVGLEDHSFLSADHATAIDVILHYVANFGHMGVGWDKVAVWQDEAGVGVWVRFQRALQVVKLHIPTSIFSNEYIVNEIIHEQ